MHVISVLLAILPLAVGSQNEVSALYADVQQIELDINSLHEGIVSKENGERFTSTERALIVAFVEAFYEAIQTGTLSDYDEWEMLKIYRLILVYIHTAPESHYKSSDILVNYFNFYDRAHLRTKYIHADMLLNTIAILGQQEGLRRYDAENLLRFFTCPERLLEEPLRLDLNAVYSEIVDEIGTTKASKGEGDSLLATTFNKTMAFDLESLDGINFLYTQVSAYQKELIEICPQTDAYLDYLLSVSIPFYCEVYSRIEVIKILLMEASGLGSLEVITKIAQAQCRKHVAVSLSSCGEYESCMTISVFPDTLYHRYNYPLMKGVN